MKFIKKHKQEFILLSIILIILIALGIAFLVMWYSGSGDLYGDRLDGIEKYEITDTYMGDKTSIIKGLDYVEKVDYSIEGKLISFMVTVKDGTDLELAKKISNIIITNFLDEELSFYDIQLYLLDSGASRAKYDEAEEDNKPKVIYPAIGYKHKTSKEFVW